jgi:hypothetical protein
MVLVLTGGSLRAEEIGLQSIGNWVVSETNSPLDYTPLIAAINRPRDGATDSAQLLLRCRTGRTSLAWNLFKLSENDRDYTIFYSVNNSGLLVAGKGTRAAGNEVLLQGDAERILRSLPDEGDLNFRLVTRSGLAVESTFALHGWAIVKTKLAAACRWLPVSTHPRN